MTELTELTIAPEYRLGIIPAKTPHDVIVQATSIAKELAKLVKDNHLSNNIQGRNFVKVEGWSTMGAMLGVLPREISTIRQDDGSYESTVELIRISDGAVIGRASALVGMDEVWGSRKEYARRSMAVTRATGKAYRLGFSWIMALAGYEPTPAEEMQDTVEGEYREASGSKQPPESTSEPKAQTETAPDPVPAAEWCYSDGSKVGDNRGERANYQAYVKAHDGKTPNNIYNLRNWKKAAIELPVT